MTKTQKIIILAAAVLIIVAILFPPYYSYWEDRGWQSLSSGYISIFKLVKGSPGFYPIIQLDIYASEIFGTLILAGVAFLVTKKGK